MDIGVTLIVVAAGAILTSTLIATVSRLDMRRSRVSLKTANRPPRRFAVALVAAIRRTTAPAAPQTSKRVATYTLLVFVAALPLLLTACGKGGGGGGGGGGY